MSEMGPEMLHTCPMSTVQIVTCTHVYCKSTVHTELHMYCESTPPYIPKIPCEI